jgi:hypothetical protein
MTLHTVACRLKAGISESERASIARQRPGSHVSCTTELTFSWQRPGKCLFSQLRKERFHDNGGINCSIRCSLVGKPSSYKRGQNFIQKTDGRIPKSELKSIVVSRVKNWRQSSEVKSKSLEVQYERTQKMCELLLTDCNCGSNVQ